MAFFEEHGTDEAATQAAFDNIASMHSVSLDGLLELAAWDRKLPMVSLDRGDGVMPMLRALFVN